MMTLLERLARGPILCDGSMVLRLREIGPEHGLTPEQAHFSAPLNLTHPLVVEAVHRSYLDAGCQVILTNTFHATPFLMEERGLPYERGDMVEAAVRVARRTAGDRAWVLGDIGPPRSVKARDLDACRPFYEAQAQTLHHGGVDAIIIEYLADPEELALAVSLSKAATDRPVIATPVFGKTPDGDYRTPMRTPDHRRDWGPNLESMIRVALDAGADAVGTHCGQGLNLDDYLAMARRIAQVSTLPIVIQPNADEHECALEAGVGKRDALIHAVPALLDAGVRILGGCCGTRPDDLRAMAAAMRGWCRDHGVEHPFEMR